MRLIVALLVCLTTSALAESLLLAVPIAPPFGLQWGMSLTHLQRLNVVLNEIPDGSGTTTWVEVDNLPSPPSDGGTVKLGIHAQHGLQQVVWESQPQSKDTLVRELLALLKTKYGEPHKAKPHPEWTGKDDSRLTLTSRPAGKTAQVVVLTYDGPQTKESSRTQF